MIRSARDTTVDALPASATEARRLRWLQIAGRYPCTPRAMPCLG
ncbi:hypothetical protein ACFOLC_08500 [Lysobacter cavernae]|uniref:Uncharacterized protein n=1 Tax=Lysobacter cavernae TaxID=1685901 RepID=A0ABV7RPJ0_9GAMM